MKCLSCGKNFDGEKYYCICPKCGTYNKPEDKTSQTSPEADFIYEEPQAESDREDAVKSPDVDITKTAASVPDAQETREKKAKRNLLILIVIFLALSFLFTIVKNIVVGYLGTDNYKASHREDVTEVAVSKGKVGQAYTVEKDYGRTLTVASAEVLAEADTVEGLPKGQRLIAVRLESNQVDSIDYDSYENAPVDDFYISYDGSFRSEVGTYQFDKGGYDDLIGNRQSISPYDFMGSGAHAGYVFFFVPKEAENIAFFYSIADTDSGEIQKYVSVPLHLDVTE